MIGGVIVVAGAAVTLWCIAAALYWIVHPGETDPAHPKRLILKDDR